MKKMSANKEAAILKERKRKKEDHRIDNIIRKMDSSVNRLKDHNSKHPEAMVTIPRASLHKITI